MEKIEELITNSLRNLLQIGKEGSMSKQTESSLIFPLKGKGSAPRVSEQEARFLFVRELEQERIPYSIETPTKQTYRFEGCKTNRVDVPTIDLHQGTRANIDVCVFELSKGKYKRKNLIEFKHNSRKQIEKDFLKLLCDEEGKQNYFVHVIEDSKINYKNEYQSACAQVSIKARKYLGKSEQLSCLKIFLFNFNNKTISRYVVENYDVKD
jgi:hypothetical protein